MLFSGLVLPCVWLLGPSGQKRTQDLSCVVGDSINITCDFPRFEDCALVQHHHQHCRSGNFLCKGENSLTCTCLYPNKNKYSFTDGRKGNNFKVTIKNPQESDAGVYWCGSHFTQKTLTYVSLYRAITFTGMKNVMNLRNWIETCISSCYSPCLELSLQRNILKVRISSKLNIYAPLTC